MLRNEGEEDEFEFSVRLCNDVILEALLFADRRQITEMERVGRRFHRIEENFFRERPFLRLGLKIDQKYLFYSQIL